LREKRRQRALGLEEVSEATGISTNVLQALENEDRTQLPAEVYVKAFYKKYAKYLGINSAEIDTKYHQQDENLKKTGPRHHFSTVITLKGREENLFFEILRRLFLPLSILASGILVYWLYKNYLAPTDEIGFLKAHFPSVCSFVLSASADIFT
jgi:cytoskeletal protein RodZ